MFAMQHNVVMSAVIELLLSPLFSIFYSWKMLSTSGQVLVRRKNTGSADSLFEIRWRQTAWCHIRKSSYFIFFTISFFISFIILCHIYWSMLNNGDGHVIRDQRVKRGFEYYWGTFPVFESGMPSEYVFREFPVKILTKQCFIIKLIITVLFC